MVRPEQHAAGGAYGCAKCAGAAGEPRRASARRFSRDAPELASKPDRASQGWQIGHRAGGRAMSEIATLKIWRGDDKKAGLWETHEVPFERGQSVLDGLRWIRANRDPSLAIRFSCINANACKECMMELDGTTIYACTARLEPRVMSLSPLSNKQLVRDLVTEIAPPGERWPLARK